MTVLWPLLGLLALVCANGLFVAAEFAIVTVRKTRIDQLIAEGHRGARVVRRAISQPDRYIAATQLGITMASLGLGWLGEPALASLLMPPLEFLPPHLAQATAHTVAIAIAFTLITAVEIVFGELTPKWIALDRAEATALWLVRPLEIFMRILWPFIRVVHGAAHAVVRAMGLKHADSRAMVHSEEELKMLVTASQEAGVLEEHEEEMLHRVFGFADVTAGQVMIPRTELVAVKGDTPLRDVVGQIARGRHTRLPVYRQDVYDVVGMLHVSDVLRAIASPSGGATLTAASLAREALTVPETINADDLLTEMRRRRVREAIVIDEYGGTAGLVTFESLMERIVGDIPGEWAPTSERVSVQPDGSAFIDGLALVTDVNSQFDLHIDEDTYTTIGGYMLGCIGRRPKIGDTVDVEGRRMRVEALDGLRVAKVSLSKPVKKRKSAEDAGDVEHGD
ncbi:MAG TPA: hemolysin family protein [Vicinamibacterales bacterium]|nr:hemolysin family protein [Vicinamibacterales bacterium]